MPPIDKRLCIQCLKCVALNHSDCCGRKFSFVSEKIKLCLGKVGGGTPVVTPVFIQFGLITELQIKGDIEDNSEIIFPISQ